MKCNNCGFENAQGAIFCQKCGSPISAEPSAQPDTQPSNPVAARVLNAFKDKMFLVLCILLTCSVALSLTGGSVNLLGLLNVIFLWQIFANSGKGIVDTKNMRCLSGVVYAMYVILIVLVVILLVSLVATGALLGASFNDTAFVDEMMQYVTLDLDLGFDISGLATLSAMAIFAIFAAIFVVTAIVCLVFTFGYRKIHRFAKSTYQAVDLANPTLIECAEKAKGWLWALGILNLISAVGSLSDLIPALAAGCEGVATIFAAILIKKYVLSNDTTGLEY